MDAGSGTGRWRSIVNWRVSSPIWASQDQVFTLADRRREILNWTRSSYYLWSCDRLNTSAKSTQESSIAESTTTRRTRPSCSLEMFIVQRLGVTAPSAAWSRVDSTSRQAFDMRQRHVD